LTTDCFRGNGGNDGAFVVVVNGGGDGSGLCGISLNGVLFSFVVVPLLVVVMVVVDDGGGSWFMVCVVQN
jgi:hypothetical protein